MEDPTKGNRVYITVQTRMGSGETQAQISSDKKWSDDNHASWQKDNTHHCYQFAASSVHVQDLWFITHPDRD